MLRTLPTDEVSVSLVNLDTDDGFNQRAAAWIEQRDWRAARLYRLAERDPVAELGKAWPSWNGRLPYTVFIDPQGDLCEQHGRALTRTETLEAIQRCKQ